MAQLLTTLKKKASTKSRLENEKKKKNASYQNFHHFLQCFLCQTQVPLYSLQHNPDF